MSNNESIKDTLDVIRRALEDKDDFTEKNDNILILNKKVNDDGTVKLLNQSDEINAINNVIKAPPKPIENRIWVAGNLADRIFLKVSSMAKHPIDRIINKIPRRLTI